MTKERNVPRCKRMELCTTPYGRPLDLISTFTFGWRERLAILCGAHVRICQTVKPGTAWPRRAELSVTHPAAVAE